MPLAAVEEQKIISTNKFTILCIVTFGLYTIWWQYKVWRFFKQYQQSDTWPALRALFSIFTVAQLLKEVQRFGVRQSVPATYNTGGLATGYILLSLMSRLPDPVWVVAVLAFTCLIPAYKTFTGALLASQEVRATEQVSFSTRQMFLLVVCGILWILSIIGMTLPEENM